jgi:O-antigen ligase
MKHKIVNQIFSKKILGFLCLWLISLSTFGFPLTSAIPVLLKINSTPINIGLRFFYLGIAIYLVIGGLLKNRNLKIVPGGWLIVVFWFIYSIRLLYDVEIRGIVFDESSFKFYSKAFGSCLLTAIAILLTTRYIISNKARKTFRIILLLSNISIIFIVSQIYGSLDPSVTAARVNFIVELDGKEVSILNPITIGLHGTLLAVYCLAELLFVKNANLKKIFLFGQIVIGIYVILLGGSRGPILGFVLVVFVVLIIYLIMAKKSGLFFFRITLLPMSFIVVLWYYFLSRINWDDFVAIKRISQFVTERNREKEVRDYQWSAAWNQFVENPILGDQFLEKYANYYPHNIYLEVLMATGLVGGSIFFLIVISTFIKASLEINNGDKHIIFFILLLVILLGHFTSGSLFEGIYLWSFLPFYLAIKKTYNA